MTTPRVSVWSDPQYNHFSAVNLSLSICSNPHEMAEMGERSEPRGSPTPPERTADLAWLTPESLQRMIDEAVMRRSHTPAPSDRQTRLGPLLLWVSIFPIWVNPRMVGRPGRPLPTEPPGRGRPVAGTETQAVIGRWYLWPREANARYRPWEAVARTGRGRPLLGQAVGGRC